MPPAAKATRIVTFCDGQVCATEGCTRAESMMPASTAAPTASRITRNVDFAFVIDFHSGFDAASVAAGDSGMIGCSFELLSWDAAGADPADRPGEISTFAGLRPEAIRTDLPLATQ